ncbi:hypothetical protein R3P38DRAFT_3421809 [Favolaschia claudopus]|uniref:Uncharacterized protein n=1 Tax=Favolaschia claudopus TaxID=2862362 RepID=A0AAW0D8M8_9AGAR
MPVLTRKMRKEANLPALPSHFPSDVPKIPPRPRNVQTPNPSLRLRSPVYRFDAPTPLSPLTRAPSEVSNASLHPGSSHQQPSHRSSPSSRSRSRSVSTFSSSTSSSAPTEYDPALAQMHPGVVRRVHRPQHQQQHPLATKWLLEEEIPQHTIRMSTLSERGGLDEEWGYLGRREQLSRESNESRSSQSTARGTTPTASSSSPTSRGESSKGLRQSSRLFTRRQGARR